MGWKQRDGIGEFDGWSLSTYDIADDEYAHEHQEFWGRVREERVWRVRGPRGYVGAARTQAGAKDLAETCLNNSLLVHLGGPELGVRVVPWGRYNSVEVVLRVGHSHAWLEYTSLRYREGSDKMNYPLLGLPLWTVARHLRRKWRGFPRPAKDEQRFAVWEDVVAHVS